MPEALILPFGRNSMMRSAVVESSAVQDNESAYGYIHNYLAGDDIVTKLPPWGMVRYGKDHEITFRMIFVRRSLADVTDEGKVVFKTDPSEAEDLFFANAEAEKPELFIFWSADGEHFRDSGCRYTPSDHTWVGAKIGLFALAEKQAKEGRADFLSVRTEKI